MRPQFLDRLSHSILEVPAERWTKLHSTNALERLNRELKRRTRVVSIFRDRPALERLVGALLLDEQEEWIVARHYISERLMSLLKGTSQQLEELAPGAAALLHATARPESLGPRGAFSIPVGD